MSVLGLSPVLEGMGHSLGAIDRKRQLRETEESDREITASSDRPQQCRTIQELCRTQRFTSKRYH